MGAQTKALLHTRQSTPTATSTKTEMPRHFLRDTDINLESATNVPQLLHSSTATTSSDSNQPMCDTSQGADCRTHDFPNLFASPDTNLRKVLDWTRANATRPDVAEWLQQCNQWETAVTTRSFQKRNKRRKLCADHLLTTTRAINTNHDFEAKDARCLHNEIVINETSKGTFQLNT